MLRHKTSKCVCTRKHLKRHYHEKREPWASFHYDYHHYKILALFHFIRHIKEQPSQRETWKTLTMYSMCHCLDSPAPRQLSLKKEVEKKKSTSVSQSLRLKIKRISMFLLTSFQNGQQEAFKTSFIVWEPNVKNNFALAIQLPRHRALSRYQGAIRKQAETWSADLARRWISYRWNQFLSTTLYRKFKEINSLALYIQSTLNFDPFS